MSKVLIEESTLTSIANAIREKTATSSPIQVSNMNTMILNIEAGGGTGNAPTAEELTISGYCNGIFKNGVWDWFINKYGNDITTVNINDANGMFDGSHISHIPFAINFNPNMAVDTGYMFNGCQQLESLPQFTNCRPYNTGGMFQSCVKFTEIDLPSIDWSYIESPDRGEWEGDISSMFYSCHRLRKLPTLSKGNPNGTAQYSPYFNMATACYSLEEAVDLPVCHETVGVYENMFVDTFYECNRLTSLTFQTNADGSPKTAKWTNQHIELWNRVGWGGNSNWYPDEKAHVYDDATYQKHKDNPDWFTSKKDYSRYNLISALETLRTLPNTKAFVQENGGTNTITFSYNVGHKNGGDIYTNLTEARIAEVADKGWTIAFVQG